jgi:hypothetical protein
MEQTNLKYVFEIYSLENVFDAKTKKFKILDLTQKLNIQNSKIPLPGFENGVKIGRN